MVKHLYWVWTHPPWPVTQQRPLHHDYKQTKTLPVIMIDGFKTRMTDLRSWKWFTETSHIITVTGQTHTHIYIYIYIYIIIQYYIQQYQKTPQVLPSLSSRHTHNTHSLLVLRFKTVAFVFENQSNKITTDSLTNGWFFASIIYMLILTSIIPEITS